MEERRGQGVASLTSLNQRRKKERESSGARTEMKKPNRKERSPLKENSCCPRRKTHRGQTNIPRR